MLTFVVDFLLDSTYPGVLDRSVTTINWRYVSVNSLLSHELTGEYTIEYRVGHNNGPDPK